MASPNNISAFVLGAAGSGSGKTTLSLAILAAFRKRRLAVAPFKCGPDYIDPLFHRQAAGGDSLNLDSFFQPDPGESFRRHAAKADLALVEGVMGLFDGYGSQAGEGSTGELARSLGLPVILVVNATGMAGSLAPLVKGFRDWLPGLRTAGVIANFTGSPNHGKLLAEALKENDLPPLLGSFRRDESLRLPERHLGLEIRELGAPLLDRLAAKAEAEIDLDLLLDVTRMPRPEAPPALPLPRKRRRLGVARDEAFTFYYPENFQLLEERGVEIVPFSPLRDAELPPALDALWFGGGYPELYARELSANQSMRRAVAAFAEQGGFVYGECGGYLYLAQGFPGTPFVGLLPGEAKMNDRAAALGYRRATTLVDSPFGPAGTELRGHEFHYSTIDGEADLFDCESMRGEHSIAGTIRNNVMGSYLHLHFASTPAALAAFTGVCP